MKWGRAEMGMKYCRAT